MSPFKIKRPAAPLTAPLMPVLFIGHGNPLNAIEDNEYSRAWKALAATLPRPRAVLCVSAHWLTRGSWVLGSEKPRTIHDFWGFPPELYRISYPAAGAPDLAGEVRQLVKRPKLGLDLEWGLDHGTWSVMRRLFPEADVPVTQLSVDMSRPARFHYDLGRQLARLREQGVLVIASGNLVHNLGLLAFEPDAEPFDWAVEFDARAAALIRAGDHEPLIAYDKLGRAADLSIPTPDHYFPLLYALALQRPGDRVSFPVEGIAQASVGMRSVLIGGSRA